MQFFVKKTYPLMILQSNRPYINLSVNIRELNIHQSSDITNSSKELIDALNFYMGNDLDDSSLRVMYVWKGIVVFRVYASTERIINFTKPDISIMYIVRLLLKYKVVFITNIPHNCYYQILNDVSEQWTSQFLGQSPHS